MNAVSERQFEQEARRILQWFVQPESYLTQLSPNEFGLFQPRSRSGKPVLRLDASIWDQLQKHDFLKVRKGKDGVSWTLSEAGRAYWRRTMSTSDPFRAQHQMRVRRRVPHDGRLIDVEYNEAEASLAWLSKRKGANGKPLLTDEQVDAGERLRRDFTIAQMNPRTTADWSFVFSGNTPGLRPRDPAEMSDMALAARERLARAFDAVGDGLVNVLVEACCNQRGLEEIERSFGWPQRSAKVVLQIALDQLARHYGIAVPNNGRGR